MTGPDARPPAGPAEIERWLDRLLMDAVNDNLDLGWLELFRGKVREVATQAARHAQTVEAVREGISVYINDDGHGGEWTAWNNQDGNDWVGLRKILAALAADTDSQQAAT